VPVHPPVRFLEHLPSQGFPNYLSSMLTNQLPVQLLYNVHCTYPSVFSATFPPVSLLASRVRFFKLLRSPGIDAMESIPLAYVAWLAGTITLFLLGS
jgi:hypothetical protein